MTLQSTNVYRALLDMVYTDHLGVAVVSAIHLSNMTSTVMWPGGSSQIVRGTSVNVGSSAFIRSGSIEGPAPSLPTVTIDV